MNPDKFRKEVEKELKTLNNEQLVQFAWLCAARALPLLGARGNFDFWNKKDRQRYLYAVFCALDFNLAAAAYAYADAAARAAARAAAARADAAAAYADAAADDAYAAADARAAAAAAAAARAAAAAAAAYADDAAADAAAAYAAAAARAAARAAAAAACGVDLHDVTLKDIELIRTKRGGGMSIILYGRVWDSFQLALKAEKCEYWGRLYENIFKNGIEWAREDVMTRINVPIEIRDKGADEVGKYLQNLEKGAERLNEARIIILGEKGAGKTCLARKLEDPNAVMTTDNESTAGVDTTIWKLESDDINVHIWDFAGHTVTHAVHRFFLSERCLYIIVYDGRTEERNRLEYWLDHMKNFGGNSKAIILVNRRDSHKVDIPINSLKDQYAIEGLYEFSIQDDKEDLENFRTLVSGYIRDNPSWDKQLIPSNYYKVKKELESRFLKGDSKKCEERITKDKFHEIAQKYGVEDVDGLLDNLHALGISLWYKDMAEFNTLVLNPEWISNGVYRIINWTSNEKKHHLTIQEFLKVFEKDPNRYPEGMHGFLFNLMEYYELAYRTKAGKCLVIPHLLKEDRPEKLPEFPLGEGLMLRYRAEQPLPPNTISRFIVRHNQEIKKEKNRDVVWRYGVVLEDGKGSIALVREEDRTISVSVMGRSKTEYLSILRETLNDIFNSYKSNKPELQYRVERFGKIPEEVERKNPLWLPDTKILNHSKNNVPYYEDITGQNIDLHYTVNNYNITTQTLISGQGNVLTDHSIHNTFNFHNCSISLQGSLNELAGIVERKGDKESAEDLKYAVDMLEQAEQCNTPEEAKKKGIVNGLKRVVQGLGNENSNLHKTIDGVKQGVSIAQDIAKGYNDIAQWLGLPQVPKPFLKKGDKE